LQREALKVLENKSSRKASLEESCNRAFGHSRGTRCIHDAGVAGVPAYPSVQSRRRPGESGGLYSL
jgi:hypothetical protein